MIVALQVAGGLVADSRSQEGHFNLLSSHGWRESYPKQYHSKHSQGNGHHAPSRSINVFFHIAAVTRIECKRFRFRGGVAARQVPIEPQPILHNRSFMVTQGATEWVPEAHHSSCRFLF
jgi:hypothetical protein